MKKNKNMITYPTTERPPLPLPKNNALNNVAVEKSSTTTTTPNNCSSSTNDREKDQPVLDDVIKEWLNRELSVLDDVIEDHIIAFSDQSEINKDQNDGDDDRMVMVNPDEWLDNEIMRLRNVLHQGGAVEDPVISSGNVDASCSDERALVVDSFDEWLDREMACLEDDCKSSSGEGHICGSHADLISDETWNLDDTWLDLIGQEGGVDDGHDDEWEFWDAEFRQMVSSFWEIDGPS
ncbi:hypothetical protein TIFTF001_005174 [Ficus carica]|uniref:Uncharacterized protein n=1 Tax=Ficus carica TaxID=3494 RepID=A0AA87ZN26_FICCA|nr:hypothetical protein TIFTF001_005174 [Ficus carica]